MTGRPEQAHDGLEEKPGSHSPAYSPHVVEPTGAASARIHPLAAVIGSVTIGELIFVAPGASIRGDEGQNIHVGDYSDVRDGVVVNRLETFEGDHELPEHEVQVAGKTYSVSIEKRVSLAHQSQVHGPAKVGDDTFQEQADALPLVTPTYPYRNLNEGVLTVNMQLAKAGQPKQINR